jgi:UDP-N-acetylglucosamine 2-epimerase
MESKEITKVLNELEDRFPVDTWRVSELDIWPYLRFKIGSRLFHANSKKPVKSKTPFLKEYFLNFFKYLYVNLFSFLKTNKGNADFLFVENGVHVSSFKNSYYFTRTDPIRDNLETENFKCLTLVGGYKISYPLYNIGIYFQYDLDLQYFLEKIAGLFKKPKPLKYQLTSYDEFLLFLRGNDLFQDELELDNLLDQIQRIEKISKYFEKILHNSKPKALLILCYYSTYGFGLISACKKLKIPVIDIQHGIQGDYHYAYGSFTKVPKTGFNLHPDIFYVWSEQEKKSISKWATGDTKVFIGGNNFLELWKDDSRDIVRDSVKKLNKDYSLKQYSKVILYTVHPQYGYDKEIFKAIRNSPKNWFWFVRLHPKKTDMLDYTKKRIGEVRCRYEIEDIHLLPLYALLKVSDIHITTKSSTVIEASSLGVKSVVTSTRYRDLFKRELDEGMVVFKSEKEDINSCIMETKRDGKKSGISKEGDIMELVKMMNI